MAHPKKKKLSPYRLISILLSAGLLVLIVGLLIRRASFPVLNAAGPIASGQQQLMVKAFFLMFIVVLPVFVLTFWFAWRYRETNTSATYKPNWDRNRFAEIVWWTVPTLLIISIGIMTWRGTFALDPYKPLASSKDTLKVQVVALDWRWLFIYPEQNIASINELRLPVNKAVRFDITADAPMNSFWIPQLGGQIYAMPGMGTRLNLKADRTGEYYGSSANISGEGFSKMNFKTIVTSESDFDAWVTKAKSQKPLSHELYSELSKQTDDQRVYTFGRVYHGLYGDIIGKYHGLDHHGDRIDSEDAHANLKEQH